MSDSNLTLSDVRTPEQARSDILRRDRERWYAARKVTDGFAILSLLDGREVAMCASEADRDFLIEATHQFYLMRDAISNLNTALKAARGI